MCGGRDGRVKCDPIDTDRLRCKEVIISNRGGKARFTNVDVRPTALTSEFKTHLLVKTVFDTMEVVRVVVFAEIVAFNTLK